MNKEQLAEWYGEEDYEAAAKRLEEQSQAEAQRQADAILKKHKREIARLNKHAQGAVLENNFPAYKYALTKLRALYRQPTTDELVETMWQTTRQTIWNIINDSTKEVQTPQG